MSSERVFPRVVRPGVGLRFAGPLAVTLILAACGGGGGGGDGGVAQPPDPDPAPDNDPPPETGDDARRVVLSDIGTAIIVPSLEDFDMMATGLQAAAAAVEAAPGDVPTADAAKAAWNTAMTSWQRAEVLQVGPAGRSTNPDAVAGGQDLRDFIYSWPFTLDTCAIEAAAANGDAVDGTTPINITGLGAIEHLLFTDAPDPACASQPDAAARAAHLSRLADRVALLATSLLERWDPTADNYLEQWSTAGLESSVIYSRPQDALDALSIALFYVEKQTKDRKVALPTGLPVTDLNCADPIACPEFLESRLSRRTGQNLVVNFEAFRDLFTGVDGGMGVNDLLIGIDRQDLADQIIAEVDDVLALLAQIEGDMGFDAAVEAITDNDECVNAFSSSSGLPPCALLGVMKTALDTFRGPVVSALGLAVPSAAAGDND
ncbi:MAG: imelysin family protein [Pseudomonadota bacterium]